MDNRHFNGGCPAPGHRHPSFAGLDFSTEEVNALLHQLIKMQDIKGLVSGVNIVNIENHELLQPGNLTLEDLGAARLENMNDLFVPWQGSAYDTRNYLPALLRRKGISISYVTDKGIAVKERAVGDFGIDNTNWGLDVNWMRVDELSLSGALFVSPQGTWVINGVDSGIKAVGPKGDNGVSPYLTIGENGYIQYSYDKVTWFDLLPVKDITPDVGIGEVKTLAGGSKATVTKSCTNANPLLNFGIPMGTQGAKGEKGDGFQAKGFVDSVDDLPTSGSIGDTYIVGSAAPYAVYMYKNSVSGFVNMGSVTEVKASIFDGGRADTVYGGAREVNCGGADAYLI